MTNRNLSPLNKLDKFDLKKINNRPFSSIAPRTSLQRKNININTLNKKASNNIRLYLENNLYEYHKDKNRSTETRNKYNRLYKKNFTGKEKYSNFTIFIQREMNYKDNKTTKKLKRQHSAMERNSQRMYKDNPFYLTETIIKKHHKKNNYYRVFNYKENNQDNNFFPYIDFGDKNENTIINNYKYKNISILRKIENDIKTSNNSLLSNPDKNIYLFQKKLEYVSLNQSQGNKIYNYLEDLNEYLKKKYDNKLTAEKAKRNFEEYKNENELLNTKINSLRKSNKLYNDLFVYKYNDYIKFLGKQVDINNKNNYYLLNEIFLLQKETFRLKMRINKLLEDKKFFNKFIFLQIRLQEKKIKLPDYYDYILNHTLEESICQLKDILTEKEIKHIFDYKKNIIYKDYESYCYQIKLYENENREMINKLDIVKKEVKNLQIEKKKLSDEEEELTIYLNKKTKEKLKERSEILNKYNLLSNQKNKLLKQINFKYVNKNSINKKKLKKKNKSGFSSYYNNYFKDLDKDKKKNVTNKTRNESYNKTNIRQYNRYYSPKTKIKSFSIDEQIFSDYNIDYDNTQSNHQHSTLYYKIRKLLLLLSNFIKKEQNSNKKQRITTENGLIMKMLIKIEEGVNLFLENEKIFYMTNQDEIIKLKMKMEKERKILKGQRQMAIIKAKNERMKKIIEEKSNKIYFLPKNKKRAVSAFVKKKVLKKKEQARLIKKKEFRDFLDEFNED